MKTFRFIHCQINLRVFSLYSQKRVIPTGIAKYVYYNNSNINQSFVNASLHLEIIFSMHSNGFC